MPFAIRNSAGEYLVTDDDGMEDWEDPSTRVCRVTTFPNVSDAKLHAIGMVKVKIVGVHFDSPE
jgi:hypothetical protein